MSPKFRLIHIHAHPPLHTTPVWKAIPCLGEVYIHMTESFVWYSLYSSYSMRGTKASFSTTQQRRFQRPQSQKAGSSSLLCFYMLLCLRHVSVLSRPSFCVSFVPFSASFLVSYLIACINLLLLPLNSIFSLAPTVFPRSLACFPPTPERDKAPACPARLAMASF